LNCASVFGFVLFFAIVFRVDVAIVLRFVIFVVLRFDVFIFVSFLLKKIFCCVVIELLHLQHFFMS